MDQTHARYSEHMPVGKFKGQHIRNVPLAYLLWCVGQYHFRRSRPLFVESCLRYLRERLEDLPAVLTEVMPKANDDVPHYVRNAKVEAKRKRQSAKRLAAVEMSRRVEAIREARLRMVRNALPQGIAKTGRTAPEVAPGSNPDDICDLV